MIPSKPELKTYKIKLRGPGFPAFLAVAYDPQQAIQLVLKHAEPTDEVVSLEMQDSIRMSGYSVVSCLLDEDVVAEPREWIRPPMPIVEPYRTAPKDGDRVRYVGPDQDRNGKLGRAVRVDDDGTCKVRYDDAPGEMYCYTRYLEVVPVDVAVDPGTEDKPVETVTVVRALTVGAKVCVLPNDVHCPEGEATLSSIEAQDDKIYVTMLHGELKGSTFWCHRKHVELV
jgi:hypothetical protein